MSEEIERKFLLTWIDYLLVLNYSKRTKPNEHITQNYLSITEEGEVRIRESKSEDKTRWTLTYKYGKGLVREEHEIEIDEITFTNLLRFAHPIRKTRRYFEIDDQEVSIDIYGEELDGLIIAEVEFDSVESASNYKPPSFFNEVTNDESYKNKNLWNKIQNKI